MIALSPEISIESVSSTLSRTMSRILSAGTKASPGSSICTWWSRYRMATSRSVAAAVKALSRADNLMHRSEGLGVREATTVPDTFSASSKAPRLQITFMTDAFPSREPSRAVLSLPDGGPTTLLPLLHYQKSLTRSRGGGDWRIVDKFSIDKVSVGPQTA